LLVEVGAVLLADRPTHGLVVAVVLADIDHQLRLNSVEVAGRLRRYLIYLLIIHTKLLLAQVALHLTMEVILNSQQLYQLEEAGEEDMWLQIPRMQVQGAVVAELLLLPEG
jgi:hypothetical protein